MKVTYLLFSHYNNYLFKKCLKVTSDCLFYIYVSFNPYKNGMLVCIVYVTSPPDNFKKLYLPLFCILLSYLIIFFHALKLM